MISLRKSRLGQLILGATVSAFTLGWFCGILIDISPNPEKADYRLALTISAIVALALLVDDLVLIRRL